MTADVMLSNNKGGAKLRASEQKDWIRVEMANLQISTQASISRFVESFRFGVVVNEGARRYVANILILLMVDDSCNRLMTPAVYPCGLYL